MNKLTAVLNFLILLINLITALINAAHAIK